MIEVFTLTGCKHCQNLKSFLDLHDVKYIEKNIEEKKNSEALFQLTNQKGVPVLNQSKTNEYVVGFNEEKISKLLNLDPTHIIQKDETKNICHSCRVFIDSIYSENQLTDSQKAILEKPQKVITVNIPLKKEDGSINVYNGYRVQYNNALGPTKGGLRFHPEVDVDEVNTLAFLMALKTSLVSLPLGGAKGGIDVDPKELSRKELEKLSRKFVELIGCNFGPDVDVPAPDINTDGEIISWMSDEYNKIHGYSPATFTGKPVDKGGSEGRVEATALGGFFVLEQHIKTLAMKPNDLTVAVQGFGNVGANIAKILHDNGYKVIAISDVNKALYDKDGIDITEVLERQTDTRFLPEMNLTEIPKDSLLELECDVLIPAAISNQITKENQDRINAKIILEMANAPVTPEADKNLKSRVDILPDILVNAGGVIVSYFEYIQNLKNEKWSLEKVNTALKKQITSAYDSVQEFLKTHNDKRDFRGAAYNLAITKILNAEKERGNID